MDYIKTLGKFTKTSLICASILLIYGYLTRLASINFFWESKSFGYALLFIGLISLLADGIRIRKSKNQKTVWNKIGIGFIVFTLVIRLILIIMIPNSIAYSIAKDYIKHDSQLIKELGEIKGFGLIPSGGIQVTKDSNGEQGSASINLILKGQNKYKEVTVYVIKNFDSNWKVEAIE